MRCYNNIFLFAYSDAQPSGKNCAIAGLGFFFAGIYPTTVSSVGSIIKGSTAGMSLFLAIAALGGIVTPQIVGFLADRIGMTAAILVLAFNAVGMLVMAAVNVGMKKRG